VRSTVATGIAVVAVGLAASSLAGCDSPAPERREPPKRVRRVIEPPTERVGPLPPYAIRADGVGPYKVGDKLSDLLERLASGPRIALFEIPGVVHRNVIRAEDDTILIGGEQASTASFVAVIGGEVARTESGIHVGSTHDELARALGPALDEPQRVRDPRVVVPTGLPNLRVVLDGGEVAAIVVTGAATRPRQPLECQRPASSERGFGACMTPAGELIAVSGDDVVIRSADGERVIASLPKFPGLLFAAPLHLAAESRDELVIVTRTDEAASRRWGITAYRLEGVRPVRTVDATQVYQLSSANARWIGAELRDVELYLELTNRPDGIDLGGLLTTRSAAKSATKFRDVVVISSASVPRRRGKPAVVEASDAGAQAAPRAQPHGGDAGVDALDPSSEPAETVEP
jgi:hypothetical protein